MDKVDMSLDDIIKMNRKQMRQNKKNKPTTAGKGAGTKKPYITKQTLQKKLQNQQTARRNNANQGNKRLNIKPKPQKNRALQQQNANRKINSPGQGRKGLPQKRGAKPSLQQQKAQTLQQKVDRRRKLQQNRMRVNRPGSVTSSNQSKISDAKLLRIAKALLLKKSGANLLTTPQVATNAAYSARRLRQQTKNIQTSPKRRDWNRMANADPSKPESILTVHVKNDRANAPRRKRLNRPSAPAFDHSSDLVIQTVNNPVASMTYQQRAPPPVSDIVKSMKPKVEMAYDFSKDVFAQGKTGVGLSQRFSSGGPQTGRPAASGSAASRHVYW